MFLRSILNRSYHSCQKN
uniref:Uncharacterized protein n=1 Tax=Amphimedon queenslandica TaxID=400682 RepID=A0A1X7VS27_AMPQE